MNMNKQIEILYGSDNKKAYQVLKELIEISKRCNDLYPYFDIFVEMMNNRGNSYIRTRGLRLIAYNSKWDKDNKIESIIEKWLEHIEDEKPITARQCIKDTVIIAKNKPELIEIILEKLENLFDDYVLAEDTKCYKPNLKFFEYASKKYNLTQKEHCHIAKGYWWDIVPCSKLGWDKIWVNRTHVTGNKKHLPYQEITTLDKLKEIL